ncbi:hypothetical protein MMC22_000756 [Lobaria immixta]|nr:hypothetical protein [Lobaria immixta]
MSSHPFPLPSISSIHKALADFQLFPSTFRVLFTLSSSPTARLSSPSSPSPPSPSPPTPHPSLSSPKTLYILDSSFNPPTLAHLDIATSALHSHHHDASFPRSSPCRLLLLLATQNADKQSGPASFERRLTMMGLLAGEIARAVGTRGVRMLQAETTRRWQPPIGSDDEAHSDDDDLKIGAAAESDENKKSNNDDDDHDVVTVDIGVTKKPYFHDKAAAIAASGVYYHPPPNQEDGEDANHRDKMEQVYLVGFGTLIRLLDPKYYPPSRTSLRALDPFFSTSRVRVTRRAGRDYGRGKGGGRELQDEYVRALAAGEREEEGGRREWARRVQLVWRSGGEEEAEEEMISSTKVREAMRSGDEEVMKRLVPEAVRNFILDQGLYRQVED